MSITKETARMLAACAAIGTLHLAGATAARAQASWQKALAAHLRKTSEGDVEDPDQREVRFSDMNGDGVLDAVVSYTLDQRRTLNYSNYLAIFLRKKGIYQLVAYEIVGGKFFGKSLVVESVVKGVIIAQAFICPTGDSECDHPVKKQVRLVLSGGKLREK